VYPFCCIAFLQVNYPKKKNTFCKKCNKHTSHSVSQYKKGKDSTTAQGMRPGLTVDLHSIAVLSAVTVWLFGLAYIDRCMRDAHARASGKRRYDRKQAGYGGQTKPVFKKKVRAAPALTALLLRLGWRAHSE